MFSTKAALVLRGIVAAVWLVALVALIYWMHLYGITIRSLPRFIKTLVEGYGIWGPIFLLVLHVIRTFVIIVPTTALTFVAGGLYGPVWGTLINIIGDNISAQLGFFLARVFGRRFVREHEHGWLKRYDTLLREQGFWSVLFMRLLLFPFDVVNYGCGLTGMLYRDFALGTFLGLLPAIITLTVLGDAFTNPKAFVGFVILFVLTLTGVFVIRRSHWVQKHILSKRHDGNSSV